MCAAGCIRLFNGHSAPVRAVAISPDGNLCASASEDRTVRLWHLATGRCFRKLAPHAAEGDATPTSLAFNTSGRMLAIGGGTRLSVWELKELNNTEAAPVAAISLETPAPVLNALFMPGQPALFACGSDRPAGALV